MTDLTSHVPILWRVTINQPSTFMSTNVLKRTQTPCKYDHVCFRHQCQRLTPKTINLFGADRFQSIFALSIFSVSSISCPSNVEKHEAKPVCNKCAQKFGPSAKHSHAACVFPTVCEFVQQMVVFPSVQEKMMIFIGLKSALFSVKKSVWHAVVPRHFPAWKFWKAGVSGRDGTVTKSRSHSAEAMTKAYSVP